jgi:hypothetical protein
MDRRGGFAMTMKIKALGPGDKGPEIVWLKKWLNYLVDPSPKLKLTNKFDNDTGAAVQRLKVQWHQHPLTGTADMHVITGIWRAAALQKQFGTPNFGGQLRFDKEVLLDHFFQSFTLMTDDTVANLLWLLTRIESDSGFQVGQIPWVAYLLATAYHETGYTLAPVKERGCDDVNGCTTITNDDGTTNTRDYGDPVGCPNLAATPPTACPNNKQTHTYYGRGFVQLTHQGNYKTTSKILHKKGLVPTADHLVHFPEKAMDDADLAYAIISIGMRDEGDFFSHGKTFDDYIPLDHPVTPAQRFHQYKEARKLVNGTNKNTEIAKHAVNFEALLTASRMERADWERILGLTPPATAAAGSH